jgi:two-component system, NtrC family, response regulator HydG
MTQRILVIDDDQAHAESIAELLSLHRYEVEVAFSGEDGVARFREADFDLTFMDVKLPGMNGVETFFAFKRIRPDAKVVMMTGFSVEQLVAQAVENGALGVLHKPFNVPDLLAAVERIKPRGMVLVADDDAEFTASISPVLSQGGYRVEIARTGQEAIDKALANAVDCLLLDLRMPVLSGLEVYLKLKELGRAVPTVLVTGYVDEEADAIARLRAVTGGLLRKPFDPAVLLQAVAAARPDRRPSE